MLHWCGVARDGQIIGESVLDSSALPSKYAIQELAARLMAKRPTPGFEYATGEESLRAIKLHIHDANDSTVWGLQVVLDATYPESRAKSVLSNMVKWSQPHRATNLWRTGDPAAVRKNMNEKLKAVLTQANTKEGPTAATHVLAGVDEATALMHHNIELLLERQEKARDAQQERGRPVASLKVFSHTSCSSKALPHVAGSQVGYGARHSGHNCWCDPRGSCHAMIFTYGIIRK